MARQRGKGSDDELDDAQRDDGARPDDAPGATSADDAPVAGGDDGPDDGPDDGFGDDELDDYRRFYDPAADFFQDHPVLTALAALVLVSAVVLALVVPAARDRSRPVRTTTTTTVSTTAAPPVSDPAPRPAREATDAPVPTVVEASGRCGKVVDDFRTLFGQYPSGATVDTAGNDRLNELLGRLDPACSSKVAEQFRSTELDVWLHRRPLVLDPGVTTTTSTVPGSAPTSAPRR